MAVDGPQAIETTSAQNLVTFSAMKPACVLEHTLRDELLIVIIEGEGFECALTKSIEAADPKAVAIVPIAQTVIVNLVLSQSLGRRRSRRERNCQQNECAFEFAIHGQAVARGRPQAAVSAVDLRQSLLLAPVPPAGSEGSFATTS
jgi:hypothetical protein